MVHTITYLYVMKNLLIEIQRPVIVLWLQVKCYIPSLALGVMIWPWGSRFSPSMAPQVRELAPLGPLVPKLDFKCIIIITFSVSHYHVLYDFKCATDYRYKHRHKMKKTW